MGQRKSCVFPIITRSGFLNIFHSVVTLVMESIAEGVSISHQITTVLRYPPHRAGKMIFPNSQSLYLPTITQKTKFTAFKFDTLFYLKFKVNFQQNQPLSLNGFFIFVGSFLTSFPIFMSLTFIKTIFFFFRKFERLGFSLKC